MQNIAIRNLVFLALLIPMRMSPAEAVAPSGGGVSGRVIDGETGAAIADATVYMVLGGRAPFPSLSRFTGVSQKTDRSGRFTFPFAYPRATGWTIVVTRAPGYLTPVYDYFYAPRGGPNRIQNVTFETCDSRVRTRTCTSGTVNLPPLSCQADADCRVCGFGSTWCQKCSTTIHCPNNGVCPLDGKCNGPNLCFGLDVGNIRLAKTAGQDIWGDSLIVTPGNAQTSPNLQVTFSNSEAGARTSTAQFEFSKDGGVTWNRSGPFVDNESFSGQGSHALRTKGTSHGNVGACLFSSCWRYRAIMLPNYRQESGDVLEYDIAFPSSSCFSGSAQGGLEVIYYHPHQRDDGLRFLGARDQNGVPSGPGANLAPYACGRMYHRAIPLPASRDGEVIGSIEMVLIAPKTSNETKEFYIRNARIVNNNTLKLLIYQDSENFALPSHPIDPTQLQCPPQVPGYFVEDGGPQPWNNGFTVALDDEPYPQLDLIGSPPALTVAGSTSGDETSRPGDTLILTAQNVPFGVADCENWRARFRIINGANVISTSPIYKVGCGCVAADAWHSTGPDGLVAGASGGEVRALKTYHDVLYLGGSFNSREGSPLVSLNNIASWNGTAIAPLGGGLSAVGPGISPQVFALEVYQDELIVGGIFDTASPGCGSGGVIEVNNIASWNGTCWKALGAGTSNNGGHTQGSAVLALTVFYDPMIGHEELIAGGFFNIINGASTPNVSLIAKWNGTTWSPLGGSPGDGVIDRDDPANGGFAGALAVYDGDLIVGGAFGSALGPHGKVLSLHNIAGWNGSDWFPLGDGTLGPPNDPNVPSNIGNVNALTVWNHKLIAGGDFERAGLMDAAHIAAWDGVSWATLPDGQSTNGLGDPSNGGPVYALTVFPDAGDLIAGGAFPFESQSGIRVNDIASWNGTQWSSIPASTANNGLEGIVWALTSYHCDLVAGGLFNSVHGQPQNTSLGWARWGP